MKSLLLRLIILGAMWGLAWDVHAAHGILHENPIVNLPVATGAYSKKISKIGHRYITWELAAESFQAAAAVNPQPLTQKQLMELVAGHVPHQRIIELLRDRGIDFPVDDAYVISLRRAGADDELIMALLKTGAKTAEILVETAPNAQIFLDGNLRGRSDAQGVLTFRAKLGTHTLKVSLPGKQDFQQSVDAVERKSTRVVAPLADLGGNVHVKALSGASIWLDNSQRGTADSNGELLLSGIPPGAHTLRVTAPGKVDESRSIAVTGGGEMSVGVALADGVQVNPKDSLKYVWIAPGNFMMGCSPGDNDCAPPEKPAHPVTLHSAYWIGQTEVTVGAYKHYVDAAKANLPPESPKSYQGWKVDLLPIVDVTWAEAKQYCTWAGGRLATEAEWEFAARGGSLPARYGNLVDIAWTKENAGNRTHAVATKTPNSLGLHDTLGNVWEWVNDWFDPNYYQSGAAQDPTGPSAGAEKILRGGSWIVDPKLLRVSDRYSIKPEARSDFFGFRCVWVPKMP